ncbi:MAG: cell division protein FtsA [Bacteroidota bacterium]|nr:cell division protein FtsA [Bacteroidota bacterium]
MIPGIGGRQPTEVTKSNLCRIIQPRMTELFEIALSEIRRSGYAHKLGAGIVITGGASLLRGSEELASRIFGMPVKVGMPTGIRYTGLGPEIESPVFSTSVGLALYGLKNKRSVRQEQPAEPEQSAEPVIEEKPEKVEISQKKKNMVNKVFDFIREL